MGSDTNSLPKTEMDPSDMMISSLMNSKPSRPDLKQGNFNRHLNECKSIITFLGSFCDYSLLRDEINKHFDKLISSSNGI